MLMIPEKKIQQEASTSVLFLFVLNARNFCSSVSPRTQMILHSVKSADVTPKFCTILQRLEWGKLSYASCPLQEVAHPPSPPPPPLPFFTWQRFAALHLEGGVIKQPFLYQVILRESLPLVQIRLGLGGVKLEWGRKNLIEMLTFQQLALQCCHHSVTQCHSPPPQFI